jgi:D-serine dehydratase
MSSLQDLLDPLIDASAKGFPHGRATLRRSQIGAQGWNVLAGDLPLPLAVVKRDEVAHNIGWMRRYCEGAGVDIAPHGKTTMSPQLFREQLDAGAWGLSFATVTQAGVGVASGARRCLIANQVFGDVDLAGIAALKAAHAGLRVVFLLDSLEQLALIETWHAGQVGADAFEVLLEIGVAGGRTGVRDHASALELANAASGSPAVRLAGIECYEGLGVTGDSAADQPRTDALMQRVREIALHADRESLFDGEGGEIIVSAGGSAVFDLVATELRPALSRPVRALLRSGCYITHDHGFYRRMLSAVGTRLGCSDTLHAAIEVWAAVQSLPEPGLAILAVGKRDISYDLDLPVPIGFCARGALHAEASPGGWRITGLNDQHAYLRWDGEPPRALHVGDRVALGISHPCTTFDKWRWLPVIDAQYRVVDALVTCF